jgi:hypothetical protein
MIDKLNTEISYLLSYYAVTISNFTKMKMSVFANNEILSQIKLRDIQGINKEELETSEQYITSYRGIPVVIEPAMSGNRVEIEFVELGLKQAITVQA